MPGYKASLDAFEQDYAAAVKRNHGRLMKKKFGKRFLHDLEMIARKHEVEVSGGLDLEQGQPGITGYEQVKGTGMSSPFFHEPDFEMQFHTHVAYQRDMNLASCHPSPADMGNVSLFYPGVILWEGPGKRMHWILLRSAHDDFVTEQSMESAYNKARKNSTGNNTSKSFIKEWRATLNRAGLDFKEIKPGETSVWFPRDTHPEKTNHAKARVCPHCGKDLHYHIKKWYMENWHINPERLEKNGIIEVENPHYKKSAPMKLYPECVIEQGLKEHPELVIKPRTEKQKVAAQQSAQRFSELRQIKKVEGEALELSEHARYHEVEGLHKHDKSDITFMKQRSKELYERADKMLEEHKKKHNNAVARRITSVVNPLLKRVAEFNARNAKAPIREAYSKLAAKQFHKAHAILYKELSQQQRDIVMRELNNEEMFLDDETGLVKKYYEKLRYSFVKVPPDSLPMSSWEEIDSTRDTHETKKIEEHFTRQLKIENAIKKNGYDDAYPITIEFGGPNKDAAVVSYGNHRLQAVRNLMASGDLPRNFMIPVMVIWHDDALRRMFFRRAAQKAMVHKREDKNEASYEKVDLNAIANEYYNAEIKHALLSGTPVEHSLKYYVDWVMKSWKELGYRIEGKFAIKGEPPAPPEPTEREKETSIYKQLMKEYNEQARQHGSAWYARVTEFKRDLKDGTITWGDIQYLPSYAKYTMMLQEKEWARKT